MLEYVIGREKHTQPADPERDEHFHIFMQFHNKIISIIGAEEGLGQGACDGCALGIGVGAPVGLGEGIDVGACSQTPMRQTPFL